MADTVYQLLTAPKVTQVLVQPQQIQIVRTLVQGPAGASGASQNFVYAQSSASATWIIAHNMGKNPSVTVEDSTGRIVEGDLTYNSVNQLTIAFSAAFAGTAYLN